MMIRPPLPLLLVTLMMLVPPGLTFVSRAVKRSTRTSSLRVSWWDDDERNRRSAEAANIARTDVRNFLTQRSLQSFIYLLNSCRDPHTVGWLEHFGGWRNLESFHGTGALNMTLYPTWDVVLLEMMQQPEDVVVTSARSRGRGHGGWSKNNPHLEDRYVEFEIDVDPASLVSRIISVREQLANEWDADLDVLRMANEMILDSYHSLNRRDRDSEAQQHAQPDKAGDDEEQPVDLEVRRTAPVRRKGVAFDRMAQFMLRNSNAYTAMPISPLRQANFDLLLLLSTQEAVHRVLRNYKDAGRESDVSFEWFRDFYCERVAKYFDGNQEPGRADDFLEELLLTPPSVGSTDKGKMTLIDPMRVAEDVIRTRSKVAMDWKVIMKTVPEDHMGLRQMLLIKQMAKWGHEQPASLALQAMESTSEAFQ